MEADIAIQFFQSSCEIKHSSSAAKMARYMFEQSRKAKSFRPYEISDNKNERQGVVAQTDRKDGLISTTSYLEMAYGGKVLQLYQIGFGAEGGRRAVYCGDKRIAQIEKSGEI